MFSEARYSDVTQQERSLPGWAQEYRQLSTGPFEGAVSVFEGKELSVLRETINVATEQAFSAPKNSVVYFHYITPNDPNSIIRGGAFGHSAGFTSDWHDRVSVMSKDSDLLMIVLDKGFVAQHLDIRSLDSVCVTDDAARHFSEWVLSILRALGALSIRQDCGAETYDLLSNIILDRLTFLMTDVDLTCGKDLERAELIYRKVREIVYECPELPKTVSGISRELGIPPATLRQICTEFTGIPLDQCLTLTRLNGAHRALLASEGRRKVSDIAMDWGFMHWGRFSVRYKALFGQSPSQVGRHPLRGNA